MSEETRAETQSQLDHAQRCLEELDGILFSLRHPECECTEDICSSVLLTASASWMGTCASDKQQVMHLLMSLALFLRDIMERIPDRAPSLSAAEVYQAIAVLLPYLRAEVSCAEDQVASAAVASMN